MLKCAIVWFRQDLRVADNPALVDAVASAREVLPVFVDESPDDWGTGSAARVFQRAALVALDERLTALGAPLTILRGDPRTVLAAFADATGAELVTWNRRYEPAAVATDSAIKATLSQTRQVRSFASRLMFEPFDVANKSGRPFLVFTPFYRHVAARYRVEPPLPAPDRVPGRRLTPDALERMDATTVADAVSSLAATHRWADRIEHAWDVGEDAAHAVLERFLSGPVADYPTERDVPAVAGVSRLSPYLHFGLVTPRQVWHAASGAGGLERPASADAGIEAFTRQLVWRDFAHHLLFHFPETPDTPLKRAWDAFPWNAPDAEVLHAWQAGRTGYPFVDAGMRELWQTGWMHNRVRMVVGSFLTKHLGIYWREGAAWFWDTLVDADLANNTLGWQWVAGCGADAAPYFRIFNPTTQGRKFDPDGRYVRRYVPELAALPDRYLHEPSTAPEGVLAKAGIVVGRDYPAPIVDHKPARAAALARYDAIKGASA